jgi:hypothetical protein
MPAREVGALAAFASSASYTRKAVVPAVFSSQRNSKALWAKTLWSPSRARVRI